MGVDGNKQPFDEIDTVSHTSDNSAKASVHLHGKYMSSFFKIRKLVCIYFVL